jgi:arylsulfatase A-like enzyme
VLAGEWDVLVSLLDVYPTICGLVGIEAFGDLDRVDLSGRLAE